MTFDLAGGRRLLLAGGGRGGLWLAVGAVALVLLVLLYRYERRLVSRRVGLMLLGLRLLAAGALVAALFEPIAARTDREAVRGRLIVGVDLSESLATADPDRPADQRHGLARVLHLSPAEPIETLSRREVERRLLEGDWLARLAADHAVETIGFAREPLPGPPAALAKLLASPPPAGDPSTSATVWDPVLARALSGPEAPPLLGVVLLTDGQVNGPPAETDLADRLAARGIPVYSILIGATVPPRDAAVAAIDAPETVFRGDVAHVEATLKLDGLPPGEPVPVVLERPGAEPLRQTVAVPADGSRPVVRFRVPLDEPGPQPLTVSVAPPPGDARADNDRRPVTIQVSDDRASVLLIDGEARWEFRYLRNALARDPRVTVESVVFHPPTIEGAEPTYKTSLPDPPADGPDPLGSYDAIVVGDVPLADLPASSWARLESYVAERGGTLIASAGPRAWPSAATLETVRSLLPVLDPAPVPVDPAAIDPAHPVLPPGVPLLPVPADAASWPMLQLAADPADNRASWAALPRLPWVLSGAPKPGATALLAAPDVPSESSAVVAAQPYGLGKVLWVGTDGTWRWRYRLGDAYHHRFWGQAVRWASSGGLTGGNRFVRFGPTIPRVVEGTGARLQARFTDAAPAVGPDLLVAARLYRQPDAPPGSSPAADAVAVVPLRPVPGQYRTFEGDAPRLPLGPYVARLDVPQLAPVLSSEPPAEASFDVAPLDSGERIELSARRDALARLASATGGRVLLDAEADRLPPLLRGLTLAVTRTEETSLWDSPAALLLFFGLLTAEWVLRKWVGLP